jgi:hypothetical protein
MADRILTFDELVRELEKHKFRQLHVHHTWKPTHRDFNGTNHLQLQQGMRNYHINTNGWRDIGHHLALMPDGKWVTGRPFGQTPASIAGWNTGALSLEMVGNFDKPGAGTFNSSGYDLLEGKQKEGILKLIKYFGQRFGYGGIKFHREGPGVTKTCPGNSLNKAVMISEAKAFKGDLGNIDETGGINMVLRKGHKGFEVTKLQQDLISLGYGKLMDPYGVDGSYGSATEAAVKAFQKDYKLEVDGVAGPITQGKIGELLKDMQDNTIPTNAVDYKSKFEEAEEKLKKIREIVK